MGRLVLDMGGCQSNSSSDEEDVNVPKANRSLFKVRKNNGLHLVLSAEVKPYLKDHFLSKRITDVDLLTFSALPHGIDQQEWVATHTVSFFQNTNVLLSALSDFCSMTTCPTAKGPKNTLYEWTDDQGRKLKCVAPVYIDYAMCYIQELLTDERVFPSKTGLPFSPGFMFLIQKVFVLLFRTLAHMFSAHYQDIIAMELHPHLNTLFLHFITFSHTFRLLDPVETAPIDDLITVLTC
ncbi:MOB kinase activator 2 isoform X1 [Triplophysa dalaica]|uniref:MOB kinase activator 2 isoform X1 n=1 Tax=Triplophysa dalaica TaxID=1582913 RepID=UPI0024DFEE69|nr:MOB kinase activator 2 isoform X1 [Triplophysa dalaica]